MCLSFYKYVQWWRLKIWFRLEGQVSKYFWSLTGFLLSISRRLLGTASDRTVPPPLRCTLKILQFYLVECAGFSNVLASLAMTMIIYTWATSYCTRRHYKCFDLSCIVFKLYGNILGVSKSVCVQVLMKVDLNKEVSRVYGLSEHLLALADWTLCLVRQVHLLVMRMISDWGWGWSLLNRLIGDW